MAKFHYESVEHEPFANRGHSAREAVIAYSMLPAKTAIDSRLRPSYRFGEHQPEDVWPSDLVADLISTFGLVGKKVVDPFAGEAALPLEVYRLGGKVVCFEISRSRAQIIRDRLAQLDKCDD